jgi:hypothetical protein
VWKNGLYFIEIKAIMAAWVFAPGEVKFSDFFLWVLALSIS